MFGLITGELRQGALEGIVVEAVARAAALPAHGVRRALMLAGDLPRVAHAALTEGAAGLASFAVQLFRPVLPMLAGTAETLEEALGELGEAALEWKLDGARVQIHKAGDDVRVYSRLLNEVTPAVPEVVELVRGLPTRELIVEGEAIALRPDGSPHPFQTTMTPLRPAARRRAGAADGAADPVPFRPLYRDGESVMDESLARRAERWPRPSRNAARPSSRDRLARGCARVSRGRARAGPRRRHGQGAGRAVRGRPPRATLAQAQAGANARPGRAGRRVGPRPPARVAEQPASRGAGSGARRVRDARQDVQGNDRRDARLADAPGCRSSRSRATATRCTCVRRWWSRWPSTTCRRAPSIQAASRFDSRGSRAIGRTNWPRTQTRSTR